MSPKNAARTVMMASVLAIMPLSVQSTPGNSGLPTITLNEAMCQGSECIAAPKRGCFLEWGQELPDYCQGSGDGQTCDQ